MYSYISITMKNCMTTLRIFLLLFAALIFCFACNSSPKTSSMENFTDSDGCIIFSIDKKNITSLNGNVKRIWVNAVQGNTNDDKCIEDFRKNVERTLSCYEINCIKKEFKNVSSIDYDENKKVINSNDFASKFRPVPPDTIAENVYEVACFGRNKQIE